MTLDDDARDAAIEHFTARLRFETDPSDVAAARAAGERFVILDVRSQASWEAGHIPGALHIPRADLDARLHEIPEGLDIVVHCWGPACNAATKAALMLSRHGRRVQEMIGGYEYWAREGLQIETAAGSTRLPIDPLTSPPQPPAPPVPPHH